MGYTEGTIVPPVVDPLTFCYLFNKGTSHFLPLPTLPTFSTFYQFLPTLGSLKTMQRSNGVACVSSIILFSLVRDPLQMMSNIDFESVSGVLGRSTRVHVQAVI